MNDKEIVLSLVEKYGTDLLYGLSSVSNELKNDKEIF